MIVHPSGGIVQGPVRGALSATLQRGPSVDKLSERVSPSLCGRAAGPALRLALLVAVLIRLEEAAERVHRLVSMIALAFVERYYGKFEETELDAHWRLLAPMPS